MYSIKCRRAGEPFSGAYQQNVKRQINSASSATRAQRAVKLYKHQAALVYTLSDISQMFLKKKEHFGNQKSSVSSFCQPFQGIDALQAFDRSGLLLML